MARKGLVVVLGAVVAALVVAPIAIARAGEGDRAGKAGPVVASAGAGGLRADRIDMTGATPATAPGDAELALAPTTVPGLYYCRRYHIWSYVAGRYIAEEQGYTGAEQNMLRARTVAGQLGAWEEFDLCSNDDGHTVYLTAASGYLVTAEYGYTGANWGMLRGRGEWVDVWETFDVWSDNGRYYLRNVGEGTYFTCRVDYTGPSYQMMKGTGAAPGSWEALRFDAV
ncbi:fascin domain-containing protein [Dactylosporangium sp. CA-092794]|uniref:fascin domain-containing protein n=1 Tax=Dactylosporangium sp. CA-092794 TaxID=3239929 RepID=UPI003D92F977